MGRHKSAQDLHGPYFLSLPALTMEITRKCIISWMYSNFVQIGPQTTELAALEHLKTHHRPHIMRKMEYSLFLACLLTSELLKLF